MTAEKKSQGSIDSPVFSTFAVSRTGNRGAVSMLESALDHITAPGVAGRVNVFTVYPKADLRAQPRRGVSLYSGTPLNLALKLVPLSLLYSLCRLLRIPLPPAVWGREMRALLESDAFLHIGGTTFSDAQKLKIIYNVVCLLPGIILGKKAMMYSQTLGPFKSLFNRSCARFCLPRLQVVVPRGRGSFDNVRGLGIPGAISLADSAFTLAVPQETERAIRKRYSSLPNGRKVVGISVNSIVERRCRKAGIDHAGIWAKFIEHLNRNGYYVLLVPHSIRPGSRSSHNNDLLTIAKILEDVPSRDMLTVVEEDYDCKELRVVVGRADYYVASRFHSMISALCTETPVSVFGWGFQKYREVLSDFELEEYCHDALDLSLEALVEGFEKITVDADDIRRKIREHLPAVQNSSRENHVRALRLAGEA